jgi:hypothetical protein
LKEDNFRKSKEKRLAYLIILGTFSFYYEFNTSLKDFLQVVPTIEGIIPPNHQPLLVTVDDLFSPRLALA